MFMPECKVAEEIIENWKKNRYIHGFNVIDRLSSIVSKFGNVLIVAGKNTEKNGILQKIVSLLDFCNVKILTVIPGAAPNSPETDVMECAKVLEDKKPDCVISIGGGSVIDAVKASIAVAVLGGSPEEYYGSGLVSLKLEKTGKRLIPHIAIMTASASAAHLTKYANVTNMSTCQKKLIIDDAIVPDYAVFDYALTLSMDIGFTRIGAFDAIGHLSEVYYGFSENNPDFSKLEKIVKTGIALLCFGLDKCCKDPGNVEGRIALGLGTDLGGYAIMMGSTNGPHLNSFSLVDIMDHGEAVALLQPYYGYFFTRAIPEKIRTLCRIYQNRGILADNAEIDNMSADILGRTYADTMIGLLKRNDLQFRFKDIPEFTEEHFGRILDAAGNPQLESKLKAMPVPFTAQDVDKIMYSIIKAAFKGDYSCITCQ